MQGWEILPPKFPQRVPDLNWSHWITWHFHLTACCRYCYEQGLFSPPLLLHYCWKTRLAPGPAASQSSSLGLKLGKLNATLELFEDLDKVGVAFRWVTVNQNAYVFDKALIVGRADSLNLISFLVVRDLFELLVHLLPHSLKLKFEHRLLLKSRQELLNAVVSLLWLLHDFSRIKAATHQSI